MKHLKGYTVDYGAMSRREEVMFGLLIALAVIFALSIYLFADTAFEIVIPIVGISLFVVMVLQHRDNVKEDRARGICKGRNRVGSIYLSGALLCFVGVYLIRTSWGAISVTAPLGWTWILLAIFLIYRGGICIRAGVEYSRTIDRLEGYEAQLKHLGYELDELRRLTGRTSEEGSETPD